MNPRGVDWTNKDDRLLRLREGGLTFAEIGKVLDVGKDSARHRWHFLNGRPAIVTADRWSPSSELIRLRRDCALAFGITEAQLLSRTRVRCVVQPRQAICYIVRKARPSLSYPCIAIVIGGRDHSTIIHAVRQTEMRMRADPDLAAKINGLVEIFARRADARQHNAHVDAWVEHARAEAARLAAAALRRIEEERARAEADERARADSEDEFVAALNPKRMFCGQCDRAVLPAEAARCAARLCGLRPAEQRRAA